MKTDFSKKILGGVLLLSVVGPLSVLGAELRFGEQPSVSAKENITEDIYLAGSNVYASGPVAGDIISAGGTIVISGASLGDELLIGGNISILGDVADDLRAVGGNIVVTGNVGGDVAVAGGQIHLAGKNITGDVIVGGGTVRIDSPVGGDVRIAGSDVTINAVVNGSIEVWGEKLALGPDAMILGKLTYHAPKEMNLKAGQVLGGIDYIAPKETEKQAKNAMTGIVASGLIFKLLMSLFSAMLIGLLFKRFSSDVARRALEAPLMQMGKGFLALIAIPIASIILFFTLVGIPFGFLGIFGYIVLVISTALFTPVLAGVMIDKYIWKNSSYEITWQSIFAGAVLFFILGLIPVFGWLACFLLFLLSLGGIVSIKIDGMKRER